MPNYLIHNPSHAQRLALQGAATPCLRLARFHWLSAHCYPLRAGSTLCCLLSRLISPPPLSPSARHWRQNASFPIPFQNVWLLLKPDILS
jgi:hypothetical protein